MTDYFWIYARVFAHQRSDAPCEFPENERLNKKQQQQQQHLNESHEQQRGFTRLVRSYSPGATAVPP